MFKLAGLLAGGAGKGVGRTWEKGAGFLVMFFCPGSCGLEEELGTCFLLDVSSRTQAGCGESPVHLPHMFCPGKT